ncbi:potassium/proton antiporter [Aquabacterium sp. A08]|uniref:potassium/proton antiporter n=1 Tax=Aquabacterium sp. A08 TaxID=2718532 RepID=UPI0014204164|nr:potassium/proton antiporter [Aquabacterium sp. A08]NIC42772.1 potassium/proton antiporter [Aquabacterium sp. A08]
MMLSLDFLAIPLLTAAGLVFVSLLAGMFSTRLGFSFLLVFLVAGMLLGEDGPGGVVFDDFRLAFWVGNVALAVILLDGGLRTQYSTFRTGLKPSVWLATLGVVLCAGLTGLAAHWLLGLDWPLALLLGAIVGSTDAAAVFSLLKTSGVKLNERVAATLEIESGLNDPMAVYLTLALIGWALASAGAGAAGFDLVQALWSLVLQFGWGVALGLGLGWGFAVLLRRITLLARPSGGVRALLLVSAGLTVFGLTTWLGGSGFLAVYVFGVVVGNRAPQSVNPAMSAMDGYAWLAQAGMFLLLGLLMTPSEAVDTLWPALGVAAALMLVARPLSVWLCLKPLRFSGREIAFIAWVGLRGAVPIVLAVFPVMAGLPGSKIFFNVAVVVVLASLLLQGSTIPWSARRARVALPDDKDSAQAREVYGDFEVPGATPMADLAAFYGWPATECGTQTAAEWLTGALGRPPVVGDHATLESAELCVRHMHQGDIARVGIRLLGSDG